MDTDPREVMDRSEMTWLQVIIVAITVGLNALDGFDVLAIGFALPGIAGEWGVDPAALLGSARTTAAATSVWRGSEAPAF